MIETETEVVYKAYGYYIKSQIPLPELPNVDNDVEIVDVSIELEDLSKQWFEFSDKINAFVIKENFVMFQVPNIATFSIQDGERIYVSPLKDYDEDVVRLYILGISMGAILLQRRIFPLHGSAVAINGKAYAFVGNSGAGKSTLASSFLNNGYQLLSDDVIAVSIEQGEQVPFVTPSYPNQKLWQESLEMLGLENSSYRSIYGRETKYSVPVSSKYQGDPLPLAGVFELRKTDKKNIEIRQIQKLERFYLLYYHTYQRTFIPNLRLMDWHFNTSNSILRNIDIYQLDRPSTGFSAPDLVTLILNTITRECKK